MSIDCQHTHTERVVDPGGVGVFTRCADCGAIISPPPTDD